MSRKLVLLCLFGAAVAETPVAYDNPAAVDPNYYQGELVCLSCRCECAENEWRIGMTP